MVLKDLLYVFDNSEQKVIIKEINEENNKVSTVMDKVTVAQLIENSSEALLNKEVKSVNITSFTKTLEVYLK